jgi:hypothetical protein
MDKITPKKSQKKASSKIEGKYDRPKITMTDRLNGDEIKKLLEDYEHVENIDDVPTGTHIRYFIKDKKGDTKFRLGGTLIIKADEYVILKSNVSWSVQKKNTIFMAKKNINKIKEKYENIIQKKDQQIKALVTQIKISTNAKNN